MSRLAAVALALFAVVPALAQVVVVPAAPTPGHFVQLQVTGPSCPGVTRAVRNGAFIDIESDTPPVCIGTPPIVTTTLNVGYLPILPTDTYTIRFVDTSAPPARTITNANAGTVTVNPPMFDDLTVLTAVPTTDSVIRLRVVGHECREYRSLVRNGAFIDVRYYQYPICIDLPRVTEHEVGLLPAGTYTVRLVRVDEAGVQLSVFDPNAGSVVVAQSHNRADVPALDGTGIAVLIASIAIAAFIAIRRAAL